MIFCAFLVGAAGIAQAAHIHGDWLPHRSAQASASTPQTGLPDPNDCPLCTAMHSALPVAGFFALLVALVFQINLALFSGRKPDAPWHFAAFSRPPPCISI